jgi:hypothetical protein
MVLDAMIYIQSFIKIVSAIKKLTSRTYTVWRSHKPPFIFKIRKVGSKGILGPH